MLVERTVKSLSTCGHEQFASKLTSFVRDCLQRLGSTPPDHSMKRLEDVIYHLMSLRAWREERAIELQGEEQKVALSLHYPPEPVTADELKEVPDLVPLKKEGSPRLTFFIKPEFREKQELITRLENLKKDLPFDFLVEQEAPPDLVPLLLRPLYNLKKITRALGIELTPDEQNDIEQDLRLWQREEAFSAYTLVTHEGRVTFGNEYPKDMDHIKKFLGDKETPGVGVLLMQPFTERKHWKADDGPFEKELYTGGVLGLLDNLRHFVFSKG